MQALAWLPVVCNEANTTTGLPCTLAPTAVDAVLPAFKFRLSENGPELTLPLAYLVVNGTGYALAPRCRTDPSAPSLISRTHLMPARCLRGILQGVSATPRCPERGGLLGRRLVGGVHHFRRHGPAAVHRRGQLDHEPHRAGPDRSHACHRSAAAHDTLRRPFHAPS